MDDIPPDNVVNLNDYKRQKQDEAEIAMLQSFEITVTGQLNFDSLDELIESLEAQGLEVEAFIFPEEEKLERSND